MKQTNPKTPRNTKSISTNRGNKVEKEAKGLKKKIYGYLYNSKLFKQLNRHELDITSSHILNAIFPYILNWNEIIKSSSQKEIDELNKAIKNIYLELDKERFKVSSSQKEIEQLKKEVEGYKTLYDEATQTERKRILKIIDEWFGDYYPSLDFHLVKELKSQINGDKQ